MLIPSSLSLTLQVKTHQGKIIQSALLDRKGSGFEVLCDDPTLQQNLVHEIKAYLEKRKGDFLSWIAFPEGTLFQQAVWKELLKLDFGSFKTYQELAHKIQSSKHARAVGNACGKNPLPFFIPCHRILGAGGSLGGFSCGIAIKKKLLAFEGVAIT